MSLLKMAAETAMVLDDLRTNNRLIRLTQNFPEQV